MLRLRQIALVADDLRPVEDAISSQLGLEVCYRDPGLATFGLRHGLYPIGDRLLEVVSPRQADTTAGRFLTRRGGDGGYMVIVQVDDLLRERERVTDAGLRIVFDAQGPDIAGIHLHPRDVGAAILSIDEATPPESWGWAGTDWQYHSRAGIVSDMVGVELQSEAPDQLAQKWSIALDRPIDGDLRMQLDDAEIRFVSAADGRGDGLAGVDLVSTDRTRAGEHQMICGTRFAFV